MAHGYLFKAYASKAASDYIPSLIGTPTGGAAAQVAYYERIELPDRTVNALAISHYVAEGTNDPILSVRDGRGKTYYIPRSELEEIAAENHDDDTWRMLNALFSRRTFP